MKVVLTLRLCAINFSYFTQGTSCMDGFAIHIIGQPLISALVLIVLKIMFFWGFFCNMNKSHVYLFSFIVTLKFLLKS